jgi:hypothetical protein
MWNCAKCGAEVDDGFEVCWSCGTTIDGKLDPTFSRSDAEGASPAVQTTAIEVATPAQTLVSVAEGVALERAEVIRRHLEGAGIALFIADQPLTGLLPPANDTTTLQVRIADADRARAIIADIPAEPPPPPAPESGPANMPTAPPPPAPPKVWQPESNEGLTLQEYIRALEVKLSGLIDSKDVPGWKVNPAFDPDVNSFIQANSSNEAFAKKARSMQQNKAKYFATMRAQAEARRKAEEEAAAEAAAAAAAAAEAAQLEPPAPRPPSATMLALRRRLRRLARLAVILLIAMTCLAFVASLTYSQMGDQDLKKAVSRADDTDKDWEWDQLQQQRAAVDERFNAAGVVATAADALPPSWPERKQDWAGIGNLETSWPLTDAEAAAVTDDLESHSKVLLDARQLVTVAFSGGKYPTQLGPEKAKPADPGPATQAARVVRLLWLDALARSRRGEYDLAMGSACAALKAGQAVGDGPEFDLQRTRLFSRRLASQAVGRILGQGNPDKDALEETQKLFEDELKQPVLRLGLRGGRAWLDGLFHVREDGKGRWTLQKDAAGLSLRAIEDSPAFPLDDWLLSGRVKESHATALLFLSDAVDIAQKPLEQQNDAFNELDQRVHALQNDDSFNRRGVALPLLVEIAPFAREYLRSEAEMRVAVTVLAAERYRVAFNELPNSLEELVPKFLSKVPTDPYDGKPLRFKRHSDYLLIYSVGPDKQDNEGTLLRDGQDPQGKDIGMRLWDPEKRRKLPLPEPVPLPEVVRGS